MSDASVGGRHQGPADRVAEMARHVAHIDAQMTLLRLRRAHAVRRHANAIDMAVVIESHGLDEELRALGQSVTSEEETTDE